MSKKKISFDYPNEYDKHMIEIKNKYPKPIFNESFEFINKKKSYRFKQWFIHLIMVSFVNIVARIRFGLRVHNRKILKKYKKELKGGAITICNHVAWWDFIFVNIALKKSPYVAVWLDNYTSDQRSFIKLVKGYPIPEDLNGIKYFTKFTNNLLSNGNYVHIYPEEAMWFYYDKIRPFKKGAFTFAVTNDKPILPLVISYHKRKGIAKLFTKNPGMHISICEPIFKNKELSNGENVRVMIDEARAKMHNTAGFKEIISQNEKYRNH